ERVDRFGIVRWERQYDGVVLISWIEGGKQILTIEEYGDCRIWSAKEGKLIREFKLYDNSFGALSADGKKMMTILPGEFSLWDVEEGKRVKHVDYGGHGWPGEFSMSPDGKRAFFRHDRSNGGPAIDLNWNLEAGKILHKWTRDLKRSRDEPILFP